MTNNFLFFNFLFVTGILFYVKWKGVGAEDDLSKRILMQSNDDLLTEITNLKITELQGSTYVRWGRTICSEGNTLVHKGYMGGRKYDDLGSGTDTLCLPEEPTWQKYHDGEEAYTGYRAYLYGAELDTNDDANVFSYAVNEQDIPCALCKTNQSAIAMIPARDVCYPGWIKEYSGYLMAGGSAYYGHNHLCMDTNPEFIPGGGGDDNDHIMYLTEGRCGSLPCPTYVNGRELTGVVCSQ